MWSFPKAGPEHSNSSSKLNEFFNDQDVSTALVREAIQNSLDAVLNPKEPVRVRFSLASFPWDHIEPFLQTSQNETVDNHLSSKDMGKFANSFAGQELRCLIIEDEGTIGLIGNTDKNDARSASNFVGFWWNDGISGKGSGASGSHGVGKTTLTKISEMSLFFAVTKRFDDEKRYLLGFANLPYHRVNKISYLGYGRYGRSIEEHGEDKFMPIEEPSEIQTFLSRFALEREKSGLSVFIPGVPDTVDSSRLLLALVRDYYWPILKGDLVVEVIDRHSEETVTVSAETLSEVIQKISEREGGRLKNAVSDTEHRVGIAHEILELRKGGNPNWFEGNEPIISPADKKDIKWEVSKECFSDDNLRRMLLAFDDGQIVGFSFSLKFETTDGDKKTGIVQVFFKKTDYSLTENTQFIRNQIIISKQKSRIPAKNISCFLIAEDKDMSDYLKEAEEPAHTRWYLNRFREQRSYTCALALKFVMALPADLHRILTREDEDASIYENFADDIFSVTEPIGTGDDTQKGGEKDPDGTKPPVDIPPATQQPAIRVERDLKNPGFDLLPVGNISELFDEAEISFPVKIFVKAAYLSALGKGTSWRDYSKIDFEFQKTIPIEIFPKGSARVLDASSNTFTVELLQPNFRVSAKGFDGNRDLLIHPKIIL